MTANEIRLDLLSGVAVSVFSGSVFSAANDLRLDLLRGVAVLKEWKTDWLLKCWIQRGSE